jgi:hypothetical protein
LTSEINAPKPADRARAVYRLSESPTTHERALSTVHINQTMYLVRGLLVAAAFNLPFVSGMGIQATPLPASVTPPFVSPFYHEHLCGRNRNGMSNRFPSMYRPNNDAAVNPSTVVWFETYVQSYLKLPLSTCPLKLIVPNALRIYRDNGVTYSVFSDGGGLASVPIQYVLTGSAPYQRDLTLRGLETQPPWSTKLASQLGSGSRRTRSTRILLYCFALIPDLSQRYRPYSDMGRHLHRIRDTFSIARA